MDAKELFMANLGLARAYIGRRWPRYARDEDMLQAARLGLWLACLRAGGRRGEFSTYACACMENEIRAQFRARGGALPAQGAAGRGVDPAQAALGRAGALALIERLSGGDARTRAILIRRLHGFSLAEIADACGISRHQVARRIRAARARRAKEAD